MGSRIRTLAALSALATLGVAARSLRRALVPVRVRGESMRPTFEPGEHVLAVRRDSPWSWLAPLRPGCVVVVDLPWEFDVVGVKRAAGAPHQSVDGVVDGDGWALLGDRPTLSTDSRHHGRVPETAIRAVVLGRR